MNMKYDNSRHNSDNWGYEYDAYGIDGEQGDLGGGALAGTGADGGTASASFGGGVWGFGATPAQPLVSHPVDYELSPDEVADVAAGRAVAITGAALAAAEALCTECPTELIWYWLGPEDSVVIDRVAVPDQQASAGHCTARGRHILRVNRQARREGRCIRGAGHSHHTMSSFTSEQDRRARCDLAAERAGICTAVDIRVHGLVTRKEEESK
jgi:hypothetical protein